MMLSIFSYACWLSFVIFGEMSVHILCPFFPQFDFLLLSCMSSLYILDIKPFSDIWLTNIFSHSVGCLFILLIVSFALQKLISLMYSHLLIFTFVAFAFGVKSKKSLPRLMSWSLLLMFSSRCFMVSGLTFKSLIHFGLIFVLVVPFYSFACDCPVFPIPCIEVTVMTVI